jgi:hypothetical protein
MIEKLQQRSRSRVFATPSIRGNRERDTTLTGKSKVSLSIIIPGPITILSHILSGR